jgi:hypothetical protein
VSALSPAQPSAPADQAGGFWAGDVIVASYRLLFANPGSVLAALWLPVLLAAATLLATFQAYFTLLAVYLSSPDARLASLTASATVVGLLVWLFLVVIASARVARVVTGQPMPGWLEFRAMAPEARLFAAILRYLLVLVLAGAVAASAARLAAWLLPQGLSVYANWLCLAAMAVFGAVFSVRCGLLMPVIALRERRRILRRGWELSSGHSWQVAVIWAALAVVPTIVLQALSEFLLRSLIEEFAGSGAMTLAAAANSLAANGTAIAAIVLTLSLSSSAGIVLTTIGSCIAYPRLGPQP